MSFQAVLTVPYKIDSTEEKQVSRHLTPLYRLVSAHVGKADNLHANPSRNVATMDWAFDDFEEAVDLVGKAVGVMTRLGFRTTYAEVKEDTNILFDTRWGEA
jgi:hypothetical protein